MLVMNIDNLNNTIRVKREFDGVLGTGHSGTSLITVLNRKIQFNVGLNTNIVTNRNTSRYFNPTESLALGNTAGVGIGSTIFYTLGPLVVLQRLGSFQLKTSMHLDMDL